MSHYIRGLEYINRFISALIHMNKIFKNKSIAWMSVFVNLLLMKCILLCVCVYFLYCNNLKNKTKHHNAMCQFKWGKLIFDKISNGCFIHVLIRGFCKFQDFLPNWRNKNKNKYWYLWKIREEHAANKNVSNQQSHFISNFDTNSKYTY